MAARRRHAFSGHQGYPVVDEDGNLAGIVTRSHLLEPQVLENSDVLIVADIVEREPMTAYEEESCRSVAEKMAQYRVGRLPVVSWDHPRKLVGIVTPSDLLKARARWVEEEQRRERFIRPNFSSRQGRTRDAARDSP